MADNEWKHIMWIHCSDENLFTMIPVRPKRPVNDESIQKIISIWSEGVSMNFDDFYEEYDNEACSDWSKMRPDGEICDYDNCGDVARSANGQELAKLSYPLKQSFLLLTFSVTIDVKVFIKYAIGWNGLERTSRKIKI